MLQSTEKQTYVFFILILDIFYFILVKAWVKLNVVWGQKPRKKLTLRSENFENSYVKQTTIKECPFKINCSS